jgi:DNA-binding transcriptional ArsR family regulator
MLINQSVNLMYGNDPLSDLFAALADPTRRSILARLARGDATVNELAAPYDMSLPAVSKHIKILEQVGLLSKTRDAQRRPCHLESAKLQEATEWLDAYRELWESNFDNFDLYLQQVKKSKE